MLRYLQVIIVACLGIAITVAGFLLTERAERRAQHSVFSRAASDRIHAIERRIETTLGILQSLQGLYNASLAVERHDFRAFVEAIQGDAAVQAIEWVPLVTGSDRAAFEARARAEGVAGFQVTERDDDGRLVRAADRPEYFPVYFTEPLEGNETALGFDLASNASRRTALTTARMSGKMTATGRVTLVQETADYYGMLVFIPIYRGGPSESRDQTLVGFGLGVFRIRDLVEAAIRPAGTSQSSQDDITIHIFDMSAPAAEQHIYPRSVSAAVAPHAVPKSSISRNIDVAGRQWTIVATAQQASFFDAWQPLAVLLSGFLFTGLLALHLRSSVDRTFQVQQVVHERTADLERVAAELTRSNAELERFAYVSSHDLKAPLRAIDNLAGWIEEDLGDDLTSEVGENLHLLRRRVLRLENLLEDLLEYSRAGRIDAKTASLDTRTLVNDVVALLAPPDTHRITVSQDLPTLITAKAPLELVFRNLIGNALKHHGRPTGTIEVAAFDRDDMYEFVVADDGVGIAPEFHARVFEMFQTLKPRDEVEGSGMGLAIVKKIVEQPGGSIGIDSDPSRPGTRVRFSWPKLWQQGNQP